MDHRYLAEHRIVARYLMNKLSATERVEFEEHFIDCKECLDRLEITEECWHELQTVAAESSGASDIPPRAGSFGHWTRSWWQPAIAVAGVLLALAAGLLFLTSRQSQDADQSRAASIRSPSPPDSVPESQSAGAAEKTPQVAEPKPSVSPGQEKTQTERRADTVPADQSGNLVQPQINIPVFDLIAARRGADGQTPLVNEIAIPDTARWMLFSLELEEETQYTTFHANIITAGGRPIWKQNGLHRASNDTLTISFPARYLRPGNYLLNLEGITSSGPPVNIASYPFRISRRNSEK